MLRYHHDFSERSFRKRSFNINALLILDKESKTELEEDLRAKILSILDQNGHQNEVIELGKENAAPCLGCLACLTKHPGECVNKDTVNEIKRKTKKFDLTIFLTPVLFGHFSSTIKNAMDRGIGSHNWQVIIGFGRDINAEERSTFIDLTAKHRGCADIVHPGMDKRVDVFVVRSTGDSIDICEELKRYL